MEADWSQPELRWSSVPRFYFTRSLPSVRIVDVSGEFLVVNTSTFVRVVVIEYLVQVSSGKIDHTDLINCLHELRFADSSSVVEVKILESLDDNSLLGLSLRTLKVNLVLELLLETKSYRKLTFRRDSPYL